MTWGAWLLYHRVGEVLTDPRLAPHRDLAILALSLAGLSAPEIARLRACDLDVTRGGTEARIRGRGQRLSRVPLDQWQALAVLGYLERSRTYGRDVPLWSVQGGRGLTTSGVLKVLRRLREQAARERGVGSTMGGAG